MGYQDEVIDLTSPEWDEAGKGKETTGTYGLGKTRGEIDGIQEREVRFIGLLGREECRIVGPGMETQIRIFLGFGEVRIRFYREEGEVQESGGVRKVQEGYRIRRRGGAKEKEVGETVGGRSGLEDRGKVSRRSDREYTRWELGYRKIIGRERRNRMILGSIAEFYRRNGLESRRQEGMYRESRFKVRQEQFCKRSQNRRLRIGTWKRKGDKKSMREEIGEGCERGGKQGICFREAGIEEGQRKEWIGSRDRGGRTGKKEE
ncbi:hypothetical protein Tco_0863570 [Tanacetum coccineum]